MLLGPRRTGWVLAATAVVAGAAFVEAVRAVAPVFLPVAAVIAIGSVLLAAALPAATWARDRARRRRPYRVFLSCQIAANVAAIVAMA